MIEILRKLRDRPVFICGHPKSGTSLLRALLDGHPQLVVYPEETVFFRRYLPESQGLPLEEKLALAEKRLIHIFTWNRENPPPSQRGFTDRDYASISFEAVKAALRAQIEALGCRHPGDLLAAAVLAYGQATGQVTERSRGWVEKTPYDERFAETIYTWWPEARCVHVVRDPRDNYASYQRKHRDWTPEIFAVNWANSTRLGLENQRRWGRERYWLLRYEDLAQNPDAALEQIQAFLGIEDHETLRTPTRAGIDWGGNSMFAERFGQISQAPVARWKANLSEEEAGVIEALAGGLMLRLGYSREGIGPRARLRAWGWRLRREFARMRGKGGR